MPSTFKIKPLPPVVFPKPNPYLISYVEKYLDNERRFLAQERPPFVTKPLPLPIFRNSAFQEVMIKNKEPLVDIDRMRLYKILSSIGYHLPNDDYPVNFIYDTLKEVSIILGRIVSLEEITILNSDEVELVKNRGYRYDRVSDDLIDLGKGEEKTEEDDDRLIIPEAIAVVNQNRPFRCDYPGCDKNYRDLSGLRQHHQRNKHK
jgi:hypothetical protein